VFDATTERSGVQSYLRPRSGAPPRGGLRAMMKAAHGEPIVSSGLSGPEGLSAQPRVGLTERVIGSSKSHSPRWE
jgi:hypothetical protein